MKPAALFILLGQYGVGRGMYLLGEMAKPLVSKMSYHGHNDAMAIIDAGKQFLADHQSGVCILAGFSLGANNAPYYAASLPRCALTISYDPSIYSPLAVNGVEPVDPRIETAVCYWNVANWIMRGGYGGAKLSGRNVVTTKFAGFHLTAHYRMELHAESIAHIRAAVAETA